MAQRSTKGASKQRRDAINTLITQIRELIPVSDAVRARLSQLQVMALTNAYIATTNFFERRYHLEADGRSTMWSELFDISPTLPGFLFIVSVPDGRILYVSDSVSEYLGNSAVDVMTQMDTVYELIDDRDRDFLRQAMQQRQQRSVSEPPAAAAAGPWMRDIHGRMLQQKFEFGLGEEPADHVSFACRMNVAARSIRNNNMQSSIKFGFDRQKIMQVGGRFVQLSLPGYCLPMSAYNDSTGAPAANSVLIACCTPHLGVFNGSSTISGFASSDNIEGNTGAFYSLHRADMRFTKIEPNGEHHIGYSKEAIYGKSWYEMIHPADLEEAKSKHMELMGDYEIGDVSSVKSVCVRIQTATGDFIWLHTVMRIQETEGTTGPNGVMLPAMFNMTPSNSSAMHPFITCTNHVIDNETAKFLRAREQEVQLATRDDSSQNLYPSSVGSSSYTVDDSLTFPDVQFREIMSPLAGERIQHKSRGSSGTKRKFNGHDNFEASGTVVPQKIPKVVEEEWFDTVSTQNMVLSMPSPPLPQWDVEATNQFQPNATGFMEQSFNNFPAFGSGMMSGTTGNVPEYLLSSSSPALAFPDNSTVTDGCMTVPDTWVNSPEFYDPMTSSKSSSFSPSEHVAAQRHAVAGNMARGLPELDQFLVEAILEELVYDPHTVPSFQHHQASSAMGDRGVSTEFAQPIKMPPLAAIVECRPEAQRLEELLNLADEENTDLIHELFTLGQDFLNSQFGSIYNTPNPMYFV